MNVTEEQLMVYKEVHNIVPQITAVDFLNKASALLAQRGEDYDSEGGERSAGKVAEAFNAITGNKLQASDIWLILTLVKQVRQYSAPNYHADSAEDAIAYTALMAEDLQHGN